mmetsp:Transcript_8774/g.25005  ORF Transcript_8774/g.25005 Transcript_8774/m.25005 type:complete len:274 (+) Transcript_8774:973-1794(+)
MQQLVGNSSHPNLIFVGLDVKVNVFVQCRFLLREGCHVVVHPRNQDVALAVHEGCHQVDEVGHGLMRRASVDSTVKIPFRALDTHFEISQAAEAVRQARRPLAYPVVVTDAEVVDFLEKPTGAGLLDDGLLHSRRAILFKAFEQHLDIHGKWLLQLVQGLNDPKPAESWPFVVCCSTPKHFPVDLRELERFRVPAVLLMRWLDIQVPVHANRLFRRIIAELAKQDRWVGHGLEVEQFLGHWVWLERGDAPKLLDPGLGPLHHAHNLGPLVRPG